MFSQFIAIVKKDRAQDFSRLYSKWRELKDTDWFSIKLATISTKNYAQFRLIQDCEYQIMEEMLEQKEIPFVRYRADINLTIQDDVKITDGDQVFQLGDIFCDMENYITALEKRLLEGEYFDGKNIVNSRN